MENTPTCCNKPMVSQMVPRQVGQKIDEMETWICTVCRKTRTVTQKDDDDQPIDPDLSALPPD
jgi:hypothetical protein